MKKIEERFHVKVGETSSDGLLSLLSARCVGSCSLAPIAIYDNKAIGHLCVEQSLKEVQELIQ